MTELAGHFAAGTGRIRIQVDQLCKSVFDQRAGVFVSIRCL